MNIDITLPALYFASVALFYIGAIISAFRKLRIYKIADYLLVIFLILSLITTLGLFAMVMGWLDVFYPAVSSHVPLYILVLLGVVVHNMTSAVFRQSKAGWVWFLPGLSLILISVLLDGQLIQLPGDPFSIAGEPLAANQIALILLLLSWGGYTILAMLYLRKAGDESHRTVVKHRTMYWGAGIILFTGSGVLFFSTRPILGTALLLAAAVTFKYLVLTYRLPDVLNLFYHLASNLLSGTLALLIYALSFIIFDRIFQDSAWYQPVYNGGLMGLLLIIIYPYIDRMVKGIMQDIVGDEFNRLRALRKYSKQVSSILDTELLSRTTVDLICEELDVEEGTLFLVDKVDPEKDPPDWSLRAVKGVDHTAPNLELLPARNPITRALAEEKRILTQSELEVIPKYQTISKKIYQWLDEVEAEAFVPIHTQDEWIGLFALSMKASGGSFTDEDLEFLSSVADQTSVALQNARLVENLTTIDNELRRTKAEKNAALEKIERIRRSASDFISIKAHELRSPLTVMSGYTRLLSNDSDLMEDEYYAKLIGGLLSGLGKLQEIIDSMLYTAKVRPSSLKVDTKPISLYAVVDRICQDLQQNVQARKITLSHDGLGEIPELYGDREGLRKVFSYLITHAMTHTPSGGKIKITGRHIPLQSELLKWEGAEVIVRDTGIGVDADVQHKVFHDLAQPDFVDLSLENLESYSEDDPGERLSVVRNIVEAHNGRVWVETPDQEESELPGSEFHVVLPLRQQSHPTQQLD